jgi:maleylpyruvate isomerase
VDADRLDREVTGCAAAHQRLLAHLDDQDPSIEVTRPSRLPGWSLGHVLTHLARNADSHWRVFDAAQRGETTERYPGGAAQRDGDIEAGAPRAFPDQVADIRTAIWRLEAAWATTPSEGWTLVAPSPGGAEPVADLPFMRWREVEIHHADLGLDGFGIDDWSPEYVRRELDRTVMRWAARRPMGLTTLPEAALALPPNRRLAWLTGRLVVDGLPQPGPWA